MVPLGLYDSFPCGVCRVLVGEGDPAEGGRCAKASLELANATRRRKHIAWARKLLGDVAAIEDRPRDAIECYQAGLSQQLHHPCPSVQWKISAALAATHAKLHQSGETTHWRTAMQHVLRELAASIKEERLQTRFRESRVAREFGAV